MTRRSHLISDSMDIISRKCFCCLVLPCLILPIALYVELVLTYWYQAIALIENPKNWSGDFLNFILFSLLYYWRIIGITMTTGKIESQRLCNPLPCLDVFY